MNIWKYEIQPEQKNIIMMPIEAVVLSLHVQRGIPCIWALVDPQKPKEKRVFEVYGTGHEIKIDEGSEAPIYIGTFMVDNDSLVFHVFERVYYLDQS